MRIRIRHQRDAGGAAGPLPLLPGAEAPRQAPEADEGLERLLTPAEMELVQRHRV